MWSEDFFNTISLASHLHRQQFRNDDLLTPYISHLMSVAFLLSSVTKDENIIRAGIMHDSLEDVSGYTYEQLCLDCNKTIADMVIDLTEDKSLSYIERKQKYLDNLYSVNIDSLIISVADKYHNAISLKYIPEDKKHSGRLIVIKGVLDIAKKRIQKDHQYYILVDRLDILLADDNFLKNVL